MEESSETQALAGISNVVAESQLNLFWNNECNKAQYFLINKLKKESERLQELCNSVYQANSILDSEIKTAQDEIKSLFAAEITLKAANVELRKELLIVKDKKVNIIERNKEVSYERLWNESKNRYESIPFIKTYIETNKRAQNIRNELYELQNKVGKLNEEIVAKKSDIAATDKKRIIELANFIQIEMPFKLKLIEEKKHQISHLTKEQERLNNKTRNVLNTYILNKNNYKTNNDENNELFNKPYIGKDIDNSFLTRKIQTGYPDLNTLHLKLNQVKKIDSEITITEIDNEFNKFGNKMENKKQTTETKKTDDYMRIYFKKTSYKVPVETQRYPKRKLVDILEDVKIDKKDALAYISQANLEKIQCVNSINPGFSRKKQSQPLVSEEIEEINMSFNEYTIMPPTQFVDVIVAEDYRGAPEEHVDMEPQMSAVDTTLAQNQEINKAVSLNIAVPIEINEGEKLNDDNKEVSMVTYAPKYINEVKTSKPNLEVILIEENTNETINSVMEEGNLFDNSNRMKEIMLKREKLNLSPQFVYSRISNIIEDRSTVTSKFFKRDEQASFVTDTFKNNNEDATNIGGHDNNVDNKTCESLNKNTNNETVVPMDVDDVSAKKPEPKKPNKPITGMFTHTSEGLPTSLNISMNTTGLDDGDVVYPCIEKNIKYDSEDLFALIQKYS